MNKLEEIERIIKNFIYESGQTREQISEIEKTRTQFAQERNWKKYNNTCNCDWTEVNKLGSKISELGNESQELQNKLEFKYNETKRLVDLTVNNLITENMRNVIKMEEERQELEEKISVQKQKYAKSESQKQEYYERFGRMPELSESAKKEEKIKDKQIQLYKTRINEIDTCINNVENEISELASIKRNFKNKNWKNIFEKNMTAESEKVVEGIEEIEEESISLPFTQEEFQVESSEPVEYIDVKDFEPMKKTEICEIEVDSTKEMNKVEKVENTETDEVDRIDVLARAIVEEIIAEQTKDLNTWEDNEHEIITYKNTEKVDQIKTTEEITLTSIIAKIEDGEIVYKAQVSNGEEIKVYPTLDVRNIFLNDKQCREEISECLTSYATTENKILDSTVISKIDPTVCEVLERFAKRYNCDENSLIYSYAMSFSKREGCEITNVAPITYNLSSLKNTNLSRKEKTTISKICKKALENKNVDIIGCITGFGKIKYWFKKLFNINKVGALPEGKY